MFALHGSNVIPIRSKSDITLTNDPLVVFLYELMRDHLTMGEVGKLMLSIHELKSAHNPKVKLSNRHLAAYSKEVANQLIQKN